MSVGVIDLLEVVEVEHEETELSAVAPRFGDVPHEDRLALATVPCPGQGIGGRQEPQLGLESFALADVSGHTEDLHDIAGFVELGDHLEFAVHDCAVLAVVLLFAVEGRGLLACVDGSKEAVVVLAHPRF